MSKTAKLQLTVEVEYELNGDSIQTLQEQLYHVAREASYNGLLSGNFNAVVDKWKSFVNVLEVDGKPVVKDPELRKF